MGAEDRDCIKMRILILFFLTDEISASCCAKKDSWKECQTWAAFMPGYWWQYQKSKTNCCLKMKYGWSKVSHEDYVSGEARGETVWKNTQLKNGGCVDCSQNGCYPPDI